MQIKNNSQYYLKRARAEAKEIEFNVPDELKAKKDVDIDELFPLTIACIADLSSGIIRKQIPIKQIGDYYKELYFASKFYDAYTYINTAEQKYPGEENYFFLVGAIAYYLCDQIGSSRVLAKKIDMQTLNLSYNRLDILLYCLLNNNINIEDNLTTNPFENHNVSTFIIQYNKMMTEGINIDYDKINSFREYIYSQGDFRDIFLIDALLALFILKSEYSIFSMLPTHSFISKKKLIEIVSTNHFVRELWPAQRMMCEHDLFYGKSGVIQMPTGAGKTKALSIAIYSAFCSETTRLSIVIAPFRALCREIYDDLKTDLSFDDNIRITQISDLLQVDYVIDEIFNPDKKTVVVATPEKFLFILRQDDTIIDNIGQLILDEGHLFDDGERGADYELLVSSIISKLNPQTQKILVSAIITNVDEINKWFTNNQGVALSGESMAIVDKLPSVLKWENRNCFLYFLDRSNNDNCDFYVPRIIEMVKLNKLKGERKQRYFPDVNFANGTMNKTHDMSIACLLKVVGKDNATIFCGTKVSVNTILNRIIDLNKRGMNLDCITKRASIDEINKLSNLIEANYGNDNPLYTASTLGIFAHHAGVTEGIRNAIEYALRKELITNVICTSTLAQGVNLPIKYLIVSSVYQAGEKIKVRDFQNLIGRTARSGMFTEGTIIISDSFAYKNQRNAKKWRVYKNLLDPLNSEKCGSTILEIIKLKEINESECDSYQIIRDYYNDKNTYDSKISGLKDNSKENCLKRIEHIISVLGKIEGFIALYLVELEYSNDFIENIINTTLAYSLATSEEKMQLKEVFGWICDHVKNTFPESCDKKTFAKSLISIEIYEELKNDVDKLKVDETGKDKLITFSISMMRKYCPLIKMNKFKNEKHIEEIAKMWMNGESYYTIFQHAVQIKCQVNKGTDFRNVTIDEIVSVCNEDFGYNSSIIINSICELIIQKEGDAASETVELLQQIMQSLKYGLSDKTSIYVYELGFNDRFLAQEIAKKIGMCRKKSDARAKIKKHKSNLKELLRDRPSVFLNRIEHI